MHPSPLDTERCSPAFFAFLPLYPALCMVLGDQRVVLDQMDMEIQQGHRIFPYHGLFRYEKFYLHPKFFAIFSQWHWDYILEY